MTEPEEDARQRDAAAKETPRGQHDEDDEKATGEEPRMQAEEDEATPTSGQGPRLHRDVMQLIFSFLGRKEFALVARLSKECFSVALRMPPRRWSFVGMTESTMRRLLVSPLRKHVSRFSYVERDRWGRPKPPSLLSPALLTSIAERLAHLDQLTCTIQLAPGMEPPHWPAKLRVLELQLLVESDQAKEEIAALMTLVGESLLHEAPLVEELTLGRYMSRNDGSAYPIPGQLLAPLLQWPLLRHLTLPRLVTSSAYAIVRRMEHLTRIEVDGEGGGFIQMMSPEGPVPPRLEEIRLAHGAVFYVTSACVPLLLKVSSLRKLPMVCFALPDPTPLVPILRQLRSLSVDRLEECDLDRFVSALQPCTELTDFRLRDLALDESHLASLLASMRRLQLLSATLPGVHSLHFLTEPSMAHLSHTLRELHLCDCQLDASELVAHLRPLHSLETLVLDRCLPRASPAESTTLAWLTPGPDGFQQETWPNLRTFEWTPKEPPLAEQRAR